MKQGPYDNVIKFLYWWLKGFKLGMCKGETSILIIEWTYEMNEGVVKTHIQGCKQVGAKRELG